MSDNSDSEYVKNCNYSDSDEYEEKVKAISEEGFAHGAHMIRRVGACFTCPFCRGGKVRNWHTIRDLLNHANGLSAKGNGIKGPMHKALALYILNSPNMAHEREICGVGDCGGNEAVVARREGVREFNRAKRERAKRKKFSTYNYYYGGGGGGGSASGDGGGQEGEGEGGSGAGAGGRVDDDDDVET